MLIRRAFKFELKPDGRQACQIGKFCGCARYVYNRTLSLEKSLYAKDDKHSFRYTEATKRLPEWKNKHPFLKECHSQVLQQSLKDLDRLTPVSSKNVRTSRNTGKSLDMTPFDFPRVLNLMKPNIKLGYQKSVG